MKSYHIVILLLIFILRIAFGIISIKNIPINLTEIDVYKRAENIYHGRSNFDLYYALYPYIISPLAIFGENGIILSRILSLIFSITLIIISFVLTKNIFLPVLISIQPMNIVVSSQSKPEIFVFGFTLLSYIYLLKYKETKELKYIYIGAVFSSLGIVFKYYVPSFLSYLICSLILIRKEKKNIIRLLLYQMIPFLGFLPFIIHYNKDIFSVIIGYYNAYKPPNPHSYYVPLEGEKNIFSVMFALTCSFFELTPYSLLIFLVAIISSFFARNFLIFNLFLWISFFSLYISWPYFKFLHQYYPITAPAIAALSYGLKRSKIILAVLICLISISVIRYKNYNFIWVDEFISKTVKDGEKALFLIPLSHIELETRFKQKYKEKIDFIIYDLVPQIQNKSVKQPIKLEKYTYIFLDTIHLYIQYTDTSKKEILAGIKQNLSDLGFSLTGKFDSFTSTQEKLDPFERITFPFFKNMIYHFVIEIYRKENQIPNAEQK